MKSYSLTNVGRVSKKNQDYILNIDLSVGFFENLYIVADGLGGHMKGEVASKIASETIYNHCKNSDLNSAQILREGFVLANKRIRQYSANELSGSLTATTLTVATSVGDILYVVHVGDSGLYIYNKKEKNILKLTKDHTYVQELLERGLISEEAAKTHEDRHGLLRAVGAEKNIKPDIYSHRINKNEVYLMCSDGLSNMVTEKEMIEILDRNNLEKAGDALMARALKNGGYDNISLIIIENEVKSC